MAGAPLWLRLVLRAERMVGARVELAVHSDAYFDLVTEINRTKALLGATAQGASSRLWHLANLPAGSDVRRLREQLARMERRIVELSKALEEGPR